MITASPEASSARNTSETLTGEHESYPLTEAEQSNWNDITSNLQDLSTQRLGNVLDTIATTQPETDTSHSPTETTPKDTNEITTERLQNIKAGLDTWNQMRQQGENQTPPPERRPISVAELAERLSADPNKTGETARQISTQFGRTALQTAPRSVIEASESLSAIKEIETANMQDKGDSEATPEPLGLLSYLKANMAKAYQHVQNRLTNLNERLYGTVVNQNELDESALDEDTENIASADVADSDSGSIEAESNTTETEDAPATAEKEEVAERSLGERLDEMFASVIGNNKYDKNSETYLALRAAFAEFVENNQANSGEEMSDAEQLQQEALIRRNAALQRKQQRRQARQEFFNGLSESGKTSWNNLKETVKTSKVGRAAHLAFSVGRGIVRGIRTGVRAGIRTHQSAMASNSANK